MKTKFGMLSLMGLLWVLGRVVFGDAAEFEQGVVFGFAGVALLLVIANACLDRKLRQQRREFDDLRQSRNPELLN